MNDNRETMSTNT